MRILFALPGLHRYNRGAETTFISVAKELVAIGESVTLIGSGMPQAETGYAFLHAGSIRRDNFESYPFMPGLRNEFAYEDLTFIPGLLAAYRPRDYDVTLTCNFPFTNLALRRPILRGVRPRHVFVTQNGDWPAYAHKSETRLFGCDGLICTNPDYYERNRDRWRCQLIPNGVDCRRFQPGVGSRAEFGIPEDRFVVLMVSALDPTKRVSTGIEAVSKIPGAHMVVAGDGPLRGEIDALAGRLLEGRFSRFLVTPEKMPALYGSANVFLHLSKIESFGNVFIESMACGIPVVGFDLPRSRWIMGDNEYLTSKDDPNAISERILEAGNELPSNQVARVARAAKFSWSSIARQYLDFMHEVVASKR